MPRPRSRPYSRYGRSLLILAWLPPSSVSRRASILNRALALVPTAAIPRYCGAWPTASSSWLYYLVATLSWPVVKIVFRHRATGARTCPGKGGFVIAANHWSNFDPWPLALPFFPHRFFRFMAKSELFGSPSASS